MTAPKSSAPAGKSPAGEPPVEVLTGEDLYDDTRDNTRLVYVEGKDKPYRIGPMPPRMLDAINVVQNTPREGHPLGDNILWESRIVAAGMCGADKKRLHRTIEDVLAAAESIADRMLPGTVKRLHTEILAACRFGFGGSAETLKKDSSPTVTDGTSSSSPSTTSATGPNESSTGSVTDGSSKS